MEIKPVGFAVITPENTPCDGRKMRAETAVNTKSATITAHRAISSLPAMPSIFKLAWATKIAGRNPAASANIARRIDVMVDNDQPSCFSPAPPCTESASANEIRNAYPATECIAAPNGAAVAAAGVDSINSPANCSASGIGAARITDSSTALAILINPASVELPGNGVLEMNRKPRPRINASASTSTAPPIHRNGRNRKLSTRSSPIAPQKGRVA